MEYYHRRRTSHIESIKQKMKENINWKKLKLNPWDTLRSYYESRANARKKEAFTNSLLVQQIFYLKLKLDFYKKKMKKIENEFNEAEIKKKNFEISNNTNLNRDIHTLKKIFPSYETTKQNRENTLQILIKIISNIFEKVGFGSLSFTTNYTEDERQKFQTIVWDRSRLENKNIFFLPPFNETNDPDNKTYYVICFHKKSTTEYYHFGTLTLRPGRRSAIFNHQESVNYEKLDLLFRKYMMTYEISMNTLMNNIKKEIENNEIEVNNLRYLLYSLESRSGPISVRSVTEEVWQIDQINPVNLQKLKEEYDKINKTYKENKQKLSEMKKEYTDHFYYKMIEKSILTVGENRLKEFTDAWGDNDENFDLDFFNNYAIKILENKIRELTIHGGDPIWLPNGKLKSFETFKEGMKGREKALNELSELMIQFAHDSQKKFQIGGKGKYLNYLLMGPAGSGKTTMANILANVFNYLGILMTNNVKIVTRKDMVGQYIGETAPTTRKILLDQTEGVLFIDEAYQLAGCEEDTYRPGHFKASKGKDFGQEAVAEIVNYLDKNIGTIVVIAAGYERQINECFVEANEGLNRRFPNRVILKKMSAEALTSILINNIKDKIVVDDINQLQPDKQFFKYTKYLVDILNQLNLFPNGPGDMQNLSGQIADTITYLNKRELSSNLHSYNTSRGDTADINYNTLKLLLTQGFINFIELSGSKKGEIKILITKKGDDFSIEPVIQLRRINDTHWYFNTEQYITKYYRSQSYVNELKRIARKFGSYFYISLWENDIYKYSGNNILNNNIIIHHHFLRKRENNRAVIYCFHVVPYDKCVGKQTITPADTIKNIFEILNYRGRYDTVLRNIDREQALRPGGGGRSSIKPYKKYSKKMRCGGNRRRNKKTKKHKLTRKKIRNLCRKKKTKRNRKYKKIY